MQLLRTCTAFALLGVGGAGCASIHEHRGVAMSQVDWRPAAKDVALERQMAPGLRRITVGELTLPPTMQQGALAIDALAVRAALRDMLAASGAFDEVALSAPDAKAATDLVIETRMDRADLRRTAEDPMALRVALWLFTGGLGDWRHDETYALALDPVFTVRDSASGRDLLCMKSQPGYTEQALDFHERRGGDWETAATALWAPQPAFDPDGARVTASLAHGALHDPVRDLLRRLAPLDAVVRVRTEPSDAQCRVDVRVVAPANGAFLDGGSTDLHLHLATRLAGDKLKRVLVGGRQRALEGRTADVTLPGVDISPDRPIDVRVETTSDDGLGPETPFHALRVTARRELADAGRTEITTTEARPAKRVGMTTTGIWAPKGDER